MYNLFASMNPDPWETAMKINPYIAFSGQCAEAFRFYQQVLGGELQMMRHGDSPVKDEIPADWHDAIMHAYLAIDGNELMGCDAPPEYQKKPQGFSVTLQFPEPADTERVFNALAEGGNVTMPLAETFWSPAFGMLVDRFGISWMVSCTPAAVAAA
jgi:PhnB protein